MTVCNLRLHTNEKRNNIKSSGHEMLQKILRRKLRFMWVREDRGASLGTVWFVNWTFLLVVSTFSNPKCINYFNLVNNIIIT